MAMNLSVMREVTPLTSGDCFTIISRVKKSFDFPLHYHDEFELNLILNAPGARRIVGDNMEVISEMELVLAGPNLYHAWFTHECQTEQITEVTIQFHKDLFDEKFLQRNQLSFLKKMFEYSQLGIAFAPSTIRSITERILTLKEKNGFGSVLELLSILHDLSISPGMKILSDPGFSGEKIHSNSRRIEKVFDYMNAHFDRQITLGEVSRIAGMPDASFSRFIRKRTGKTFIDSLNDIRLGHASRMLIETTNTVAEIAYKCGFNNISNFNRIFKRKKYCIPRTFRGTYAGSRVFI